MSKFEIFTDNAGKYSFRLRARNGEIIATGQVYASKAGCLKGIESVKKNAPQAKVVEMETPAK
ncbi:YegP family protein [Methanomethylovorans sp. PtaU1.Bin093]|uniref:YegP family protein n=1 Tax=Methanomethylovorans sp. PtaU1.Bin093 TaxID=1811679 RepID=UPI00345BE00F